MRRLSCKKNPRADFGQPACAPCEVTAFAGGFNISLEGVDMIVNIDDYRPHEVSELICLKCFHRWIGVYPEYTLLKDLECKCGEVGYVIKTGQTIV